MFSMRCRACGHSRELHQHYRPGTDCASCTCPRYRIFVLRPSQQTPLSDGHSTRHAGSLPRLRARRIPELGRR